MVYIFKISVKRVEEAYLGESLLDSLFGDCVKKEQILLTHKICSFICLCVFGSSFDELLQRLVVDIGRAPFGNDVSGEIAAKLHGERLLLSTDGWVLQIDFQCAGLPVKIC